MFLAECFLDLDFMLEVCKKRRYENQVAHFLFSNSGENATEHKVVIMLALVELPARLPALVLSSSPAPVVSLPSPPPQHPAAPQ